MLEGGWVGGWGMGVDEADIVKEMRLPYSKAKKGNDSSDLLNAKEKVTKYA
jgi:hypothetical protein